MDAVLLDDSGNVDEVLVDHGDKGWVVLGGEVAEDLFKGLDVVRAVVGREGDSGEQDLDVRVFERGEYLVEVAAGLVGRQAAKAVVAAELDDDDFGMQEHDGTEVGDRVPGGGAAGALVDDFVVVPAGIELLLQKVGKRLAGLKAVTGGDAVAVADEDGTVSGPRFRCEERGGEENQTD